MRQSVVVVTLFCTGTIFFCPIQPAIADVAFAEVKGTYAGLFHETNETALIFLVKVVDAERR